MKKCFFCDRTGGSEEHIIAESVRKRMQITEVEIESGVREAEGCGQFRKPHRFERLVTHQVCEACNRGWMSQLEVDFLAAAGHLIEPDWPELDNELISEAMKRRDVIARWAAKTAITANLAGAFKYPIPKEIAIDLCLGKLPERFFVKLAHIRKRDFNLLINPGFKFVDEHGEKWKVSESGKAFDALFQLNHLAIRAINAPGVKLGFDSPDGLLPISAFPLSDHAPFTKYSFESFDDFERRLFARMLNPTRVSLPHAQ